MCVCVWCHEGVPNSYRSEVSKHENLKCETRPPGNNATSLSLVHFQVSTKTGVKLHYFNLHVLVPTAFILGSDEYHTQAGNAISLVCIIENVSDDSPYENVNMGK